MNNERRKFIRGAGVAVTAAVAGSEASATDADSLQYKLGLLEDSNSLRALQQRLLTALQQQDDAQLAALFEGADTGMPVHGARLLDARLDDTSLDLASDRRSARAELHARVQLALPFTGNGTLQQMARLQGQAERQWSERGIYTVHYVKAGTEWKIRTLAYVAA
ncbi:MAG: twin-arginine translocation signal domain-containing protein [Gammaproteobacteria bacterium]